MKIEKLNKENIKEFIGDMGISDDNFLEDNINKVNYLAIKDNDTFILGFDLLTVQNKIAIVFVKNRLSEEKIKMCIDFLNKNLAFDGHLSIDVYDSKLMKIFDNIYRTKEALVSIDGKVDTVFDGNIGRERLAEIDMKTIRYYVCSGIITCNLVKQNIQDETLIRNLDSYFRSINTEDIEFVTYDSLLGLFSELGYNVVYKNYVIE